jgi:hypothetical protein
MKSTHHKEETPRQKEWKFPCLGLSKYGFVVFFESETIGSVVFAADDWVLGFRSEIWDMGTFTLLPPNESVTLQND